ncbi:siderophore-interacting protein [Streptomyces cellulosae]|uniref:NADPH-dependent ferric siderophore reductase n=1 Tax=Streptomyces thermodiastaticus TaxID=44061 RepID=A0ABU0KG59_9ACTN|nr:NADPH-dependent ferric siderophore reductase [Streptomyces thermodiastaticus]THC55736.1 siderophore-interacting protein [Streptomyces sp. Akac8]UVT09889.1 siderophore-interacting protein [Streptomyces thermocarboxydus]WSB41575.1 siderophore-interacting protein [Streptomyces cellulosae]WTF20578.1 siderophore-interacting protein [Streptomyces cellulosae]
MTTAVAAPFRFFALQVAGTRRLGPSLVRVTFTGPELRDFRSDGRDQSLSLFLPHPGQDAPVVPLELGDGWWQGWRELPDDVRAVMRSYTLRALRADALGRTTEIDVDFVLHGVGAEAGPSAEAGPASRWAARATAGDRVLLLGPAIADNRAIRFRLPEDASTVLLWADETALPAAAAVLETLPPGVRARVWLEVPHAGDVQELPTAADAEITWFVREGAASPETPLALDAVRQTALPFPEHAYVWIAGESGHVKQLRRHFVRERGVDRRRVTFVGYWRRGLTEEQLREQA